jgi:hypothetical protein
MINNRRWGNALRQVIVSLRLRTYKYIIGPGRKVIASIKKVFCHGMIRDISGMAITIAILPI